MRRVLFSWRGIPIYSYPVLVYCGIVTGALAGAVMARERGVSPNAFVSAVTLEFIVGLIGARLLFVISHWSAYAGEPRRMWRRSDGGMIMTGGVLFAAACGIPLAHALGLPVGTFADTAAVAFLTALAFGKVGCLLHGCCAGRAVESRFAVLLPDRYGCWQRRVPVQLIETALVMVLLAIAVTGHQWRWAPGTSFFATLAAYSAARWFLAPLRDDDARDSRIIRALCALFAAGSVSGLMALP